jgi:hypothetical protein
MKTLISNLTLQKIVTLMLEGVEGQTELEESEEGCKSKGDNILLFNISIDFFCTTNNIWRKPLLILSDQVGVIIRNHTSDT